MGTVHDYAHVFNALGDPTRRVIVERVSEGPVSVSDLAKNPSRILFGGGGSTTR